MKATKKIMAYMAHGMDCQKELSTKLETTKASESIAQKATVEGVGLLRNRKLKNDVMQAEIC